MKALFFVLSLLTIALNSHASCELTLKSKTATTSGAKIGDVSFSKKQIEAIKSQCSVKRETFSNDELIKLEEMAFQKRIEKLKNKKS